MTELFSIASDVRTSANPLHSLVFKFGHCNCFRIQVTVTLSASLLPTRTPQQFRMAVYVPCVFAGVRV